jgi:hypothetical protein
MRVRQAVSIDAPVEQAFAYFDDSENSLALIPSLVEVTEVARLENDGHCLRLVALGRGGSAANGRASRPSASRTGSSSCMPAPRV